MQKSEKCGRYKLSRVVCGKVVTFENRFLSDLIGN
jgi:ribosomal protein L32